MARPEAYTGIDKELNGSITNIGKTIREAWVPGLILETRTCKNVSLAGVDASLQKVNAEWDKYQHLVSHLPEELAGWLPAISEFTAKR